MKQHITFKQLNELSKKGKERLKKWYESFDDCKQHDFHWSEEHELPLLSIGQMIEFLDEHEYWDCPCTHGDMVKKKYPRKDWVVIFKDTCAGEWFIHDINPDTYEKNEGYERQLVGELADILWEACKEILEA